MNGNLQRVLLATALLCAASQIVAAQTRVRTEVIQPVATERTVTIVDDQGARCSAPAAGFCGNCSISCPTGKQAVCKPGLTVGDPQSPRSSCVQPPECLCR